MPNTTTVLLVQFLLVTMYTRYNFMWCGFSRDLCQVCIILWYSCCPFLNKTDHHHIAEILLRVVIIYPYNPLFVSCISVYVQTLSILFRPLCFLVHKDFYMVCLCNHLTDEGDSKTSCVISTFVLRYSVMTNNHYVHVHCLVISHLIILRYMASDCYPFGISSSPSDTPVYASDK